MMGYGQRIAALENKIDRLEKTVKRLTDEKESVFSLVEHNVTFVSEMTKMAEEKQEEVNNLSDRLNLAEGMIDIFKKEIEDLRRKLYKEEDLELDEHETS